MRFWTFHYQNIMRPALGEVALDRIISDNSSSSRSLLFKVGGKDLILRVILKSTYWIYEIIYTFIGIRIADTLCGYLFSSVSQ